LGYSAGAGSGKQCNQIVFVRLTPWHVNVSFLPKADIALRLHIANWLRIRAQERDLPLPDTGK